MTSIWNKIRHSQVANRVVSDNIQNGNTVTRLPLDAVVAEVVAALVAGEPVLASVHHEPPVLGTPLTVQYSTVQYSTVQ